MSISATTANHFQGSSIPRVDGVVADGCGRRTGFIHQGARIVALTAISLTAACNKTEVAKTAPGPAEPIVAQAKLDSEIMQSLAPAEEAPADPREEEVADIRRRHPNLNAKQLMELPEVKAKLIEGVKELAERKDLQQRVNSSIAAAASMKGLDATPGKHAFSLDVSGYSDQRTDQLLHSVMSGRAERIVDFLVGEVGEATPELSLGGQKRSSNGISIEEPPQPK